MTYSEEGIIRLVGAIIRQAVKDYHSNYLKRNNSMYWHDAREFIFMHGRLENFLERYELGNKFNCKMFRKKISKRDYNIMELDDE